MSATMCTLDVPGPKASRSKMQQKNWKCWAKDITAVASPANDGYAFAGEFLAVGATVEIELGAVILHVDQSTVAKIGIVLRNSADVPMIVWMSQADSTARKWCGSLARPARRYLEMPITERLAAAAAQMLTDKVRLGEAAIVYYQGLCGKRPAVPEPATAPSLETMVAELRKALIADGWADECDSLVEPAAASALSITVARILIDLESAVLALTAQHKNELT